ncbi:MAG: Uma2 family endonuclease [Archangium sp.]|nr:Uma2 family endonuclease [Archangium sp.]
MSAASSYEEPVPLPRGGLRFPVELAAPPGFKAAVEPTWPRVSGRLEYLKGSLHYIPPCGDEQSEVAVGVAGALDQWAVDHPEFSVGANEAGMLLGGEVRGADAAVWRRKDLPPRAKRGTFRRVAPILAVEIAGQDEDEDVLLLKARWYFKHGVKIVWLVLPETREVLFLRGGMRGARRLKTNERIPSDADLPGLEPLVSPFFHQLR